MDHVLLVGGVQTRPFSRGWVFRTEKSVVVTTTYLRWRVGLTSEICRGELLCTRLLVLD